MQDTILVKLLLFFYCFTTISLICFFITFILEAFFPPRMAFPSKENSFSRMTALLSLSPM